LNLVLVNFLLLAAGLFNLEIAAWSW
jgi:hypothetical protein